MFNYEKFLELIKEGLITTHNIEKYHGSLDIELNSIGIKSEINIISKFVFELSVLNSNDINNSNLQYIITICKDLLGYYPSYIWVKNNIGWNSFKFEERYLNNKYSEIRIRFESKYEDGLYKNDLDVPEIAYHLSPTEKKDKILKNGLCPKSYNRKSKYPDRVYLFDDLSELSSLLKSLKINDKEDNKYTLYKVKMDNKMIIHTDPNFKNGFYTYDNISPYKIEVIDDDL